MIDLITLELTYLVCFVAKITLMCVSPINKNLSSYCDTFLLWRRGISIGAVCAFGAR